MARAGALLGTPDIALMLGYGNDRFQTFLGFLRKTVLLDLIDFFTDGGERIGNFIGTQHGFAPSVLVY
jgi:hypothetical protein